MASIISSDSVIISVTDNANINVTASVTINFTDSSRDGGRCILKRESTVNTDIFCLINLNSALYRNQ